MENMDAPKKPLLSIIGGCAMMALTFVVAYLAHCEADIGSYWLTALVGLAGIACGWLTGFLASPYTSAEGKAFAKYASLIMSFPDRVCPCEPRALCRRGVR